MIEGINIESYMMKYLMNFIRSSEPYTRCSSRYLDDACSKGKSPYYNNIRPYEPPATVSLVIHDTIG